MIPFPDGRKIRVLVVDDSPLVCRLFRDAINQQPDMEVVGAAPDPFVARDMLLKLKPDVMTLDVEMPRMDGLTFLRKVMHYQPMPVIVISSLTQSASRTAIEALRGGAIDVLAKPNGPNSVGELSLALAGKIRAAAAARARRSPTGTAAGKLAEIERSTWPSGSLIAIGASTGGTQAIEELLTSLPAHSPPIVIAQHIPAGFSGAFAARLNSLCRIEVREAQHNDVIKEGQALIAPGDLHMMVSRLSSPWRVMVRSGPRVCYQRPSVDVLFRSVAECNASHIVGVLLTGMGTDGAEGLLRIRRANGRTIAQDEETSVVFGMPKAAIELGAAGQVLPLSRIMGGALAALDRTSSAA
ncbi:MAG TPA: chemotaxis response regulator protein-glutamate methylesterase [Bryobacteraceae bacterium]|jgi:two-component system chemotaxis response regulator CheB|nr:chemotaxis response regulator protein-glutamate methylesterase [Bryobacteraceae bacterium]